MTPMLRLDWCSHAAAKYAVTHWHYSRSMPTPPVVHLGVWETDQFCGVLLFSRGSNNNQLRPYSLHCTEGCELTRVALRGHHTPVSRLLRIACLLVHRSQPGLRLIISYADPFYGHHGGIYQAAGWLYSGQTDTDTAYRDATGRMWHSRAVSATGLTRYYGRPRRVPRFDACTKVPLPGKHRYLYPLDAAMHAQLLPLAQPYPKRASSSVSAAPVHPAGEGGATPTEALRL